MSPRGLFFFLTTGIIWGTPYFFIAIATDFFSTASIVWIRVAIGSLVLLPIAIARGALKPALKAWPYVVLFAVTEMVFPWAFITQAQNTVSSSLAGLLITTVPFIAAFIIGLLGDKSAWHPLTVTGLIIGFSGVTALLGIDAFSGRIEVIPVLMLLGAATGYAIAPILADRKLHDVPTLGVITLSMMVVSVIYAVPAAITLPADIAQGPTPAAWFAVSYLGVVTSALGFIFFFALIKEVGPGRSTLITYVNVVVAILLGVVFLNEPLTLGLIVGFPLVVLGSYLASQRRDAYVRKRDRVKDPTGEIGLPTHP